MIVNATVDAAKPSFWEAMSNISNFCGEELVAGVVPAKRSVVASKLTQAGRGVRSASVA
jgi:hypothetical protein